MQPRLEIGSNAGKNPDYTRFVLADPGIQVSIKRPVWKGIAEPESLSATLLLPRGYMLPETFKAGAFLTLYDADSTSPRDRPFIGRIDSSTVRPSTRRRGRYEVDISSVSIVSELYQNPLTRPIMPINTSNSTYAQTAKKAMDAITNALPSGWKLVPLGRDFYTRINSLDDGTFYSKLLNHSAGIWEPDRPAIDAIEAFCMQWCLVPTFRPFDRTVEIRAAETIYTSEFSIHAHSCDLNAEWSIRPEDTVNALSLTSIDTGADPLKPDPVTSPQTGTNSRNPVVYQNQSSTSSIGNRARSTRVLIDSMVIAGEEGGHIRHTLGKRLGPRFTSPNPPELSPEALTFGSDKGPIPALGDTLHRFMDSSLNLINARPPAAPITSITAQMSEAHITVRGKHPQQHKVGAAVTMTLSLCHASITQRPASAGRWGTLTGRWTDQTTPWETLA